MTSSTKPTDKSRTKRSSFESWPGEQDATPSNEKRNDAEARERARKRWKKVKHGVLATRGFAEAGRARNNRLSAERIEVAARREEPATGAAARSSRDSRRSGTRSLDDKPATHRNAASYRVRSRDGAPDFDAAREQQIVSEAQERIRRHAGPAGPGSSVGRPRFRMALNSTHSTLITNHIVIGNRENAMDSAGLRQLGVTHVLNACVQLPNFHPQSFTYLKLDLLDNPEASITEHAKSTSSFIARAESMNGRVFCHCVSGVSRSVSVILMHLMARHRVPLREAYEHIQTLRPFIRPNEGFKLQLAKFEIAQLGCSSVADSGLRDWDFYTWNTLKGSVPKDPTAAARSRSASSVCVVQ